MSVAYVDTSVLTAIAFEETGAAAHTRRLDEFTRLISSNLLEAELRAAFARENLLFQESAVAGIEWILPGSDAGSRIRDSARNGLPAGHRLVACRGGPLCLPQSGGLSFATLDARQGTVAEALGSPLPWEAGTMGRVGRIDQTGPLCAGRRGTLIPPSLH